MKAGAGSFPQLPHSQAIASTDAGCRVRRTFPRLDDPKGSTVCFSQFSLFEVSIISEKECQGHGLFHSLLRLKEMLPTHQTRH